MSTTIPKGRKVVATILRHATSVTVYRDTWTGGETLATTPAHALAELHDSSYAKMWADEREPGKYTVYVTQRLFFTILSMPLEMALAKVPARKRSTKVAA